MVERFRNIIPKFHTIAIFESFIKISIQVKLVGMSVVFNCARLNLLTVRELSPQNKIY
jgi:hypothetical protein